MEDDLGVADVHGVPGIGAALISDDPVGPLGEHVDELPLPLVSPLRADDDDGAPVRIEHDALGNRARRMAGGWCARKNAPRGAGR
jgi:hypothetical protein